MRYLVFFFLFCVNASANNTLLADICASTMYSDETREAVCETMVERAEVAHHSCRWRGCPVSPHGKPHPELVRRGICKWVCFGKKRRSPDSSFNSAWPQSRGGGGGGGGGLSNDKW